MYLTTQKIKMLLLLVRGRVYHSMHFQLSAYTCCKKGFVYYCLCCSFYIVYVKLVVKLPLGFLHCAVEDASKEDGKNNLYYLLPSDNPKHVLLVSLHGLRNSVSSR